MAKKLWGGRFSKATDPLAEEFTRSIQYDKKLARFDVWGSLIHVDILQKSGYLKLSEAKSLKSGLNLIMESIEKDIFFPDDKYEDIHTYIQDTLQNKLGDVALKLHTARSRNDQVAFATKAYCRATSEILREDTNNMIKAIENLSDINKQIIIPGFTHLQHAQPVYLKDYLGAYVKMLERDLRRLDNVVKNIKLTLGAGALAGTPIIAEKYNFEVQKTLGLKNNLFNLEPIVNSLDAVSDRDFVIEIISALSIIAMHLSRMAEDFIIWSTKEFDFIEIDEAFCTGSSLMPQKKNADVLELVRGYSGRLYGNLVSVLTMMKGLPLTYNRDMQLDKEPLFNSFEIVSKELKVLSGLIKTLKFNKNKIEEHLKDESLYATDLVYHLVDREVPFKTAHTIIGKIIKYSIDNAIDIKAMPEDLLKKFSDKIIKSEIVKLFDPKLSVESRKSILRGR